MGFHKRFITNENVIDVFKSGGINEVIKLYTKGADVIIADAGLASELLHIINHENGKTEASKFLKHKLNLNLENRI